MEGRANAAAWIRDAARRRDISASETAVDTFAAAVSRLSDAGVRLDHTEQLLVALERTGIVDEKQGFALHASYLRPRRS